MRFFQIPVASGKSGHFTNAMLKGHSPNAGLTHQALNTIHLKTRYVKTGESRCFRRYTKLNQKAASNLPLEEFAKEGDDEMLMWFQPYFNQDHRWEIALCFIPGLDNVLFQSYFNQDYRWKVGHKASRRQVVYRVSILLQSGLPLEDSYSYTYIK